MNIRPTGPELRAWRESFGLTQEKLGDKLGVTREWVGRLETSERPVSANVFLRLQALERELKITRGDDDDGSTAVHEDAPLLQPTLENEVRQKFEGALKLAAGKPSRLGWLKEQISAPAHWYLGEDDYGPDELTPAHEEAIRQVLREEEAAKRRKTS